VVGGTGLEHFERGRGALLVRAESQDDGKIW